MRDVLFRIRARRVPVIAAAGGAGVTGLAWLLGTGVAVMVTGPRGDALTAWIAVTVAAGVAR